MGKILVQFFGVIVLFSVIGISFVGCEDIFDGTQLGYPIVTISGTPKLMMKLTATSSPSKNFSGDYTWSSASSPDAYSFNWSSVKNEDLSGVNLSECTISADGSLLGKYIRASRVNHITNTTVYSNVIGPIQLADKPAIIISGTPQLDKTITAKSDPNFSGDYKWFFASSSSSSSWTEIKKDETVPSSCFSYGNTNNFTIPITALDGSSFIGKYIMVKRLHNSVSEIQSNVLGPIQQGNLDGYVIINGTPKVGLKVIATSNSNFSGNYIWCSASSPKSYWNSFSDGLGSYYDEYYSGDSRCEFTIPENLVGRYIRVYRRNHMSAQDVWSNIIGPIQP